MKNLELENYGVKEMNSEEMQNVDGGCGWFGILMASRGIFTFDNNVSMQYYV